MKDIKIIHSADFHLNAPYESLSAAKAAARKGEQNAMLKGLASLAESEKADLVLLSGDLLSNSGGDPEAGEKMLRIFRGIPCPVFIAPGSSDCFAPGSVYSRLTIPENVVIFRESAVRFVSVPAASARVYGTAFTDRMCKPLLRGFHADRKPGVYNLLCMHAEVDNPYSAFCPVSKDELAASGMDYAALGHGHTASGLRKSGATWYSWPGCPEGRSFQECGTKTVNIVELCDGECTLRTASVASREYHSVTLDITGKDPLLMIHTSMPDNTVRDSYRITLTGETSSAPDLARLRQNLDEMFFSLQILDRTRPPESIWDSAGDHTLRGVFLKKMRALYDAAVHDSEKRRIEQAVRWGLAAMDNTGEVAIHENT